MAEKHPGKLTEDELDERLVWIAWCFSYRLSATERKAIAPLYRHYLALGYDNARAFKTAKREAEEKLSKKS
jgi:hypothetical protein